MENGEGEREEKSSDLMISWELQLFHLCHFWKLYKYSLESIDVCGKYESAMFPMSYE